jgi:DNA-binding NtrC family response regulator
MLALSDVRILVVEDDPAILEVVREVLEDEGHRVGAARTLGEALAELGKGSVRAILTDCLGEHPTEPDLGFLARLREAAPAVPIVLFTARPWARSLVPAEHGLVAVLPKPFDLDDLLRAIGRAVQREAPVAGHTA